MLMSATGTISIDGGQTGSRVRVRVDGTATDSEAGPIHTDRPVVGQVAAIARSVLSALDPRVVTHGAVTSLAAGVSGLTPAHARADELLDATDDLGISSVALAHDSISAYLGANDTAFGAVSAVGTGVVTLGVGPSGAWRVDGWGHLVGDAGSGYWIGRAGIEAALRSFDGRSAPTGLVDAAVAEFGPLPELYMVLQADPDRVSRIAAFARVVADRAAAGDPAAVGIEDAAAAELAAAASTALRRTGWTPGDHARVSWMGAVLGHNDRIRNRFAENMTRDCPGIDVAAPLGAPLDGVGRLAGVPAGHPLAAHIDRATR
ncbi:BadF/BadG/BcrA/BcrD ATPase family protein [Gordonia sinesedis]